MDKQMQQFYDYMCKRHDGQSPLLRVHMTKDEKKFAYELHKMGLLVKGTQDGLRPLVVYYADGGK